MATRADLADRVLRGLASRTLPLYAGLAAAYVAFRAGGFANIPVDATDSASYVETASHPVWSVEFLGGTRAFTVPLVYKLFSSPEWQIVGQLAISVVAWLVLAAVVARSVRHPVVRPLAFAGVLGFSLAREVTMWDTLRMSESITLSLLALVLAAWLAFVGGPSRWRAGAVLLALFFWTFARDSNAYVVLVLAVLAGLTALDPRYRGPKLAVAAGCLAIFGASFASAESGRRWLLPVKDVVFKRVLETPALERYFAEQGLPVEGNWTLEEWLVEARDVYARYLVTHPVYTFTAPFHGRQEALFSSPGNLDSLFNPDLGDFSVHEGEGFMRPPGTFGRIFFPRGVGVFLAVLGATAAVAAAVAARLRPTPVWLVPAGIVLVSYPHLLTVWHFSGYEVDRHALQAALLLRLAALLLLLFSLDRVLVAVSARRAARPAPSIAAPA